jgi:hypothetical protein
MFVRLGLELARAGGVRDAEVVLVVVIGVISGDFEARSGV